MQWKVCGIKLLRNHEKTLLLIALLVCCSSTECNEGMREYSKMHVFSSASTWKTLKQIFIIVRKVFKKKGQKFDTNYEELFTTLKTPRNGSKTRRALKNTITWPPASAEKLEKLYKPNIHFNFKVCEVFEPIKRTQLRK